jgi:hypothetical protein
VFHIIDLGQQINSMGVPHDGFIGYETFLRFVTTFDYGARVLSFTLPGHYQPPANAVVLPFEQDDRAPVLNGELDGIPLRLWLDTGSRNSLSLSSPFVRTHGLLEKYHASEEAVLGWGLGGAGRARPARLGVLRMGDIEVTGLVGDLSSTDKGALALADYGAILGGGVLRRFSMGIDYGAKRSIWYPIPKARRPMPSIAAGCGCKLNTMHCVWPMWRRPAPGHALGCAGMIALSWFQASRLPRGCWRTGVRCCVSVRLGRAWASVICAMAGRWIPIWYWRTGWLRDGVPIESALALSLRSTRHSRGGCSPPQKQFQLFVS